MPRQAPVLVIPAGLGHKCTYGTNCDALHPVARHFYRIRVQSVQRTEAQAEEEVDDSSGGASGGGNAVSSGGSEGAEAGAADVVDISCAQRPSKRARGEPPLAKTAALYEVCMFCFGDEQIDELKQNALRGKAPTKLTGAYKITSGCGRNNQQHHLKKQHGVAAGAPSAKSASATPAVRCMTLPPLTRAFFFKFFLEKNVFSAHTHTLRARTHTHTHTHTLRARTGWGAGARGERRQSTATATPSLRWRLCRRPRGAPRLYSRWFLVRARAL